MADRIDHDELARSLADSLRTDSVMTWTDLQMGPSHSARPDVYTLNKSYVSPCPTTYECKISRSDFLSDVTSGKWQAYLKDLKEHPAHGKLKTLTGVLHRALEMHGHKESAPEEDAG